VFITSALSDCSVVTLVAKFSYIVHGLGHYFICVWSCTKVSLVKSYFEFNSH